MATMFVSLCFCRPLEDTLPSDVAVARAAAAAAAGDDKDGVVGTTRRNKKCLHTALIGGGDRN